MGISNKNKTSKDKKAEQLGMPFGTASGRLRKLILFRLVQKCGEDICYKCNKQINTPEQLTVEHKMVWLDVDPALFWDLDNVAWSHARCNAVERPSGTQRRVKAPPGTSKCSKCETIKPLQYFRKDTRRWNGVKHQCKKCEAEYDKKRRSTTKASKSSEWKVPHSYDCVRCDHKWKSKEKHPKRCPQCFAQNWSKTELKLKLGE